MGIPLRKKRHHHTFSNTIICGIGRTVRCLGPSSFRDRGKRTEFVELSHFVVQLMFNFWVFFSEASEYLISNSDRLLLMPIFEHATCNKCSAFFVMSI